MDSVCDETSGWAGSDTHADPDRDGRLADLVEATPEHPLNSSSSTLSNIPSAPTSWTPEKTSTLPKTD